MLLATRREKAREASSYSRRDASSIIIKLGRTHKDASRSSLLASLCVLPSFIREPRVL